VSRSFRHAVIVACHAGFKKDVTGVPDAPEQDQYWVLESFQKKEPPFYIDHIRRGVSLVKSIPESLLLFSGGITHKDMGEWTEADSYYAIAEYYKWWLGDHEILSSEESVKKRSSVEQYARDSFENLLFGICRFQQIAGQYPDEVTMVSWAFKENRFDLHREALRFPVNSFHYEGMNDPVDLQAALKGEAETVQLFRSYRYGSGGELLQKRNKRDPFKRGHPYRGCDGMESFFQFIENPNNGTKEFDSRFPWE
jgi:hypothetical protein